MKQPHDFTDQPQIVLTAADLFLAHTEAGDQAVQPNPPRPPRIGIREKSGRLQSVKEQVDAMIRIRLARQSIDRVADQDPDRMTARLQPRTNEISNGATHGGYG